jgi:hypothetical protein
MGLDREEARKVIGQRQVVNSKLFCLKDVTPPPGVFCKSGKQRTYA